MTKYVDKFDLEQEYIYIKDSSYNYVTPQMFGAIGDGVTDDTNAFTLMYEEATSENKKIIIPPSTYLLNKNIKLDDELLVNDSGTYNSYKPLAVNSNIPNAIVKTNNFNFTTLGLAWSQGSAYNPTTKTLLTTNYNNSLAYCDKLVEIDLATNTVLRSVNYDTNVLGHGNDLDVNPNTNEVLVARGSTGAVNEIVILDATTLLFKRAQAVALNNEIAKTISYDSDDDIYLIGSNSAIYKFDSSFTLIEKLIDLPTFNSASSNPQLEESVTETVGQSTTLFNGQLYYLVWLNASVSNMSYARLYKVDKFTKTINQFNDFPTNFRGAEAEAVITVDDTIIIISVGRSMLQLTYVSSNYHNVIQAPPQSPRRIELTRIENPYFDNTAIGRSFGEVCGKLMILHINLLPSTYLGTTATGELAICDTGFKPIEQYNLIAKGQDDVAICQIYLKTDGILYINHNNKTAWNSEFIRVILPVFLA